VQVGHAPGDDDGEVRVRVLHLVEHLVVPVVRIDRHDPAAERVERQVMEEELGAVSQQQRHAVSVTVAGGLVLAAQPFDLRAHLRVRILDAGGMIGPARRRGRAEEGVLRRGLRGRGESLVDGVHHRADSSASSGQPKSNAERLGVVGISGHLAAASQLGGRSLSARS